MCNLYRMTRAQAEIANLFAADCGANLNAAAEIYPGYPGLVVADRALRAMVWGFPLVLKSKKTGEPLKPKPVNNTRSDKLDSFMWRYSFTERRCLIPVTAWAEAEGRAGRKTRTWMSVASAETFAVGGIWQNSDEWGACYSMVMCDAAGPAAEVHDRMPVIMRPEQHDQWLTGSSAEARSLCRAYDGEIVIERTEELWSRRRN